MLWIIHKRRREAQQLFSNRSKEMIKDFSKMAQKIAQNLFGRTTLQTEEAAEMLHIS